MVFIIVLTITVLGAIIHLFLSQAVPRRKERVVEVFLLYFLCVEWGFGAILTSVPHIVAPDHIAEYIGWQTGSPFQIELGFASLGLAILGVLSIWLRGVFWIAPVVGHSVFLLGAAYVHVHEIAEKGNLNPGNAGPVLFMDIGIPIIVISLLVAHIRLAGLKR